MWRNAKYELTLIVDVLTMPLQVGTMFLKGQAKQRKLNAQAANNESTYLDKQTMENNKQRLVSNVTKNTVNVLRSSQAYFPFMA